MPDAHGVMNHQEILYHYLGGNDEDKVAAAQAAVEGGVTLGGAGGRLAYARPTEQTAVTFNVLGAVAIETDPWTWQDGMIVQIASGVFQFNSVAQSGTRYALGTKTNGVLDSGAYGLAVEATFDPAYFYSRSAPISAIVNGKGKVAGDQVSVVLLGLSPIATDPVTMMPPNSFTDPWIVATAL